MDNTLYINTANNIIRRRNQITIVVGERQIYNPSEKVLLENGWSKYIPPTPSQPQITSEQMYKNKIIELVREEYSVDDELAILRQRDTKIDEFNEYNQFVEECKQQARREIYGDELI